MTRRMLKFSLPVLVLRLHSLPSSTVQRRLLYYSEYKYNSKEANRYYKYAGSPYSLGPISSQYIIPSSIETHIYFTSRHDRLVGYTREDTGANLQPAQTATLPTLLGVIGRPD